MQAASLVNATAAPRHNAGPSSKTAQESGPGPLAFADLLDKVSEQDDTQVQDPSPQQLEKASSPLEAEGDAASTTVKAADVGEDEDTSESKTGSDLAALLAGLLQGSSPAKMAADGEPLRRTKAGSDGEEKPGTLPGWSQVNTRVTQAGDRLRLVEAKQATDASVEQSIEPTPAKKGSEIQTEMARPGPQGTSTDEPLLAQPSAIHNSPREITSTASSPPSARSDTFPQTSVSRPARSARVGTLARDGLELARGHLNPVGSRTTSVQHSSADRLDAKHISTASEEQLPVYLSVQPLTEARSGPAGTVASDTAPRATTQLALTETGASSAQPALKPLSSETTASQAPVPTSALGVQSPKENLPATPPPSAMRSEAFVQTSVHSPAFAPAFSARIATLARDGLEVARVHLNPVDMGPVSVQLSLEGQQVRVDMTADVAATRRVLEQALPTLAGALREAGFTLSGGGVHQPPTDARQSTSQDGGANNSSHPQGTGTSDNLNASAGDAGGQGAAANPFRDTPQNQGSFTNSKLITVGEEGALSAAPTPAGLEGRPSAGLVDVFA